MRVESVTSAQNRKVKTLLALQEKARLRKEMGLFVVEGRRELGHCIRAGFEIDTLFYCPEIAGCSGIHLPETSFGPQHCISSVGAARVCPAEPWPPVAS